MRYQLAMPTVCIALAALLVAVHAGIVDARVAMALAFAGAVALGLVRARRRRR